MFRNPIGIRKPHSLTGGADTRQSEIFRYYYNKFEGKNGQELQKAVYDNWQEVMDLYRTLDDWFNSPVVYNLVGLLAQCGDDLSMIYLHFKNMPEGSDRTDFINYLKGWVRHQLRNVEVVDGEIKTSYPKPDVFKILLTLNIQLMNFQIESNSSDDDCAYFKFPFNVFNAQKWDIEHIDSHQTNALRTNETKQEWIDTAMDDLRDQMSEEDMQLLDNMTLDDRISHLKKVAQEETDVDETVQNSIGNLTLLDSHINRTYGNRLFCYKRKFIIEKTEAGVYVPLATQKVFTKFFDKTGTNRSRWTVQDMQQYQAYIYATIKEYLKED